MTDENKEIMLTPLAAGVGKLMSYCMLLNNALLGYMKKSGEDDDVVLAVQDGVIKTLSETMVEIADTVEDRVGFLASVRAIMLEMVKLMEEDGGTEDQ